MTGRIRYMSSPIRSRIDWLASRKIGIVGLHFAEFEMDTNFDTENLFSVVWED